MASLDDVMRLLQDVAQRVSITNENVTEEHSETRRIIKNDIATVHNTIIRDVGGQLGNIKKGVDRVDRLG